MTINGQNNESPNSDEGAPKMINGKPILPSYGNNPQDIGPEPGVLWLTWIQEQEVLTVINRIIGGDKATGWTVTMEPRPEASAIGLIPIRMVRGLERINAVIHQWRPKFARDAHDLFGTLDDAFQAWVPVDDARLTLRCAEGRSLLTEGRALALASIKEGEALSDAALNPLMDAVRDPANWAQQIPIDTTITGLVYRVPAGGKG